MKQQKLQELQNFSRPATKIDAEMQMQMQMTANSSAL